MERTSDRLARLETHVLYIKERVDSLATRRELLMHRWIIGALFGAILTLGCKMMEII